MFNRRYATYSKYNSNPWHLDGVFNSKREASKWMQFIAEMDRFDWWAHSAMRLFQEPASYRYQVRRVR